MNLKSLLSSHDMELLNEAAQHELYASNYYKYVAACMQRAGLFGAQKFFEKESGDEIEHYYLLRDFVNDMGAEIETPAIDEPKSLKEDDCLKCVLEAAYQLELELYEFYSKFYTTAKAPAVQVALIDFVNIQRKSVGEYGDLLARFAKASDMLIFDKELGKLAK
jgi:ferritin